VFAPTHLITGTSRKIDLMPSVHLYYVYCVNSNSEWSKLLPDLTFSQQCFWSLRSSGIWHCVTRWVVPNIPKDCGTFIFKNQAVSEDLTPSLPLEDIKAPQSFKTSVTRHPSTQNCIPEDMNPTLSYIYRCLLS